MLKKKKIIIALIVLFAAIIGLKFAAVKRKSPDIKACDVSEYQSSIDWSSGDDNLEPISDSKELPKKVEAIWVETYGENVKKEKAYQVFYDEKSGVWLVTGTLPSTGTLIIGGALIEEKTDDH